MTPADAKQYWQQKLSTSRHRPRDGQIVPTHTSATNDGANVLRTDFHIDYDRVVFSRAFRRLGRKTQVHPFAKSDHTHNRLTHSVEVASVGRSLGNHVGTLLASTGRLPDGYSQSQIGTVVQVACLAHDLGNPPFGHTGEAALREWFNDAKHADYLAELSEVQRADVCTYEGNAHSLRIVSRLEMYQNQGGMRLTAASIGTLLKYPWGSTHPKGQRAGKFNIYQSEMPLIQKVAATLGLLPSADTPNTWARHPLSYLMEAADDICYALLDLEDAVELGLIDLKDFENILAPIVDLDKLRNIKNIEQRCGAMRGIAIGHCIEQIATAFMTHHDELLLGRFAAKDLLAVADTNVQNALSCAKALAVDKIFRHDSRLMTEIASFGCLGSILDLLIPAVFAHHQQTNLSIKHKLALELMAFEPNPAHTLYDDYMAVLDFICALTDNTAAKLARELSGVSMI